MRGDHSAESLNLLIMRAWVGVISSFLNGSMTAEGVWKSLCALNPALADLPGPYKVEIDGVEFLLTSSLGTQREHTMRITYGGFEGVDVSWEYVDDSVSAKSFKEIRIEQEMAEVTQFIRDAASKVPPLLGGDPERIFRKMAATIVRRLTPRDMVWRDFKHLFPEFRWSPKPARIIWANKKLRLSNDKAKTPRVLKGDGCWEDSVSVYTVSGGGVNPR